MISGFFTHTPREKFPMRTARKKGQHERADEFVSVKCSGTAVRCNHPLIRDSLVQATLDPTIRSIQYLPNILAAPPMKVDAIAIERDDGRYYLDVVEARPRSSISQRLIVAQALLDLGLRPLVRTESDILREPRCSNARAVWDYAGRPVHVGLRLQVLGALADEGSMTLGDILKRIHSDRDPVPAIMAMACAGLIEIDLNGGLIGPSTLVRQSR